MVARSISRFHRGHSVYLATRRSADVDEKQDDATEENDERSSSDDAKAREREMEERGEENAA
jgi:hypothetical protein